MDFETLLEQMFNPGEDGMPDTMRDDLTSSYQDATTTRDAKIEEFAGVIAAQTAEISRLKAVNYDLMTATPAVQQDNTTDSGPGDGGGNDSDDGDDETTVDDLFEDKED